MGKLPSYNDLQQKILQLEDQVSHLKTNYDNNIFYNICEHSQNAIALFETKDNGISFTIKYFNSKAEELEQVNRNKIVGKNLSVIFPSIKQSGFLKALKNVFKTNNPEEFPAIVLSSNKISEWKHNYIYKLSETELVSIYMDVSEEKIKDYELKEHQEKLQIAMRAANYFWFEFDIPTNKITTQQELYLSLGYPDSELPNLMNNTGVLIHPDDYTNSFKLLKEQNLRNSPDFNLEIRIKNAKNQWIWFSNVGKIMKWDKNDNPISIIGLIKNIQKEKEFQFKLNESEEKFHQLSENIDVAFWLRSLNNKVIYSNPACYNILGEDFTEIFENFEVYKNWIHPEDRKVITRIRNKNKKYPDKTYNYEHRIIKQNGDVRWLWIRTFPVYNDKGELYRRAGIASDITEQKNLVSELIIAKEKAEESDKLKSSFLANVSHEIRTPMNGILGFNELLKNSDITESEKNEFFNIIDLNGKQLLNIINNILDIAIIESGKPTINKTSFYMEPLLKDIFISFKKRQEQLKKENIKFTLHIPQSVNHKIFTDSIRLQQILNNLIDNAFKFTNSGSIDMGYSVEKFNNQDVFQFYVTDTGIGISKAMKNQVFDRFKQIESKKYLNRQGTGLGLAISKEFVELLGGKIWIESSNENIQDNHSGGSTFYFTIPINSTYNKNEFSEIKNKEL